MTARALDSFAGAEREELIALRHEVRDLRRASEILKAREYLPANSTTSFEVSWSINQNHERSGFEPICRMLEDNEAQEAQWHVRLLVNGNCDDRGQRAGARNYQEIVTPSGSGPVQRSGNSGAVAPYPLVTFPP